MPTVSIDKEELFARLNRSFKRDEIDELFFQFGLELEEDTSDDPTVISGQERAQLKIEVAANRYDLLCIEGISRSLSRFLGTSGFVKYKLTEPTTTLTIHESTSQIRPYCAAAILHGVKLNKSSYESFIALQDKLHMNIARNRSLVAIGTHDLSKIKGPFTYEALPPSQIEFVPLNQKQSLNGAKLCDFYRQDKHLGKFLNIIEDSPVYPVIFDKDRNVCSVPPIINSELSKITLDTTEIFIECTATDQTRLETVIDIITTMFSEYCSEPFTVEAVQIISDHNVCTRSTPQLRSATFEVDVSYLNSCLGLSENAEFHARSLGRMDLNAEPDATGEKLTVTAPCTRPDILHAADIMEDAAVAFGYDNLPKTFPAMATIAKPLPLNKLTEILRVEAAMAGFTEVVPFILCATDENYKFLRQPDDGNAVRLENPKSLEFQIVRTRLLPGLLKTVRENRKHALPIRIFDVSDVSFKDASAERCSSNVRHFCAVYAGSTSGFEVVHGLFDRLMLMLECKFTTAASSDPGYFLKSAEDLTFLPGRCAAIYRQTKDGNVSEIGKLGILHPEVQQNFDIPFALSCVEFNIESWL